MKSILPIKTPPKAILSYDRQLSVGSELLILSAELSLLILSFRGNLLLIFAVILLDFFLISPLKAGQALLYDTLVIDPLSASFSLLFRYFRHGYVKSLCWRLLLWLRIVVWSVLLSLVPFALRLFQQRIADTEALLITAVTLLLYFIIIGCVIALSLVTATYSPVRFLLLYTHSVSQAFSFKKRIFCKQFQELLQPQWNLLHRLPFLFLILPIPYFLTRFHTEQAKQIRQRIDAFL